MCFGAKESLHVNFKRCCNDTHAHAYTHGYQHVKRPTAGCSWPSASGKLARLYVLF